MGPLSPLTGALGVREQSTCADEGFAAKYRVVAALLDAAYGPLSPHLRRPPLDELILTILSQHTSDVNSERSFSFLVSRYPCWPQVLNANTQDLADVIRVGGLGRVKAERIQSVLREILQRTHGFDLSFLTDLSFEAARAWLISLPGVGPKTAGCVQLFSIGQPALPVDTHVHRVVSRLGLVPPKTNAERTQALLELLVPTNERYAFHVNLIRHGREVCAAQRPLHEVCVLRDACGFYSNLGAAS